MMQCAGCGKLIEEGSHFCSGCGASVNGAEPKKNRSSKWPMILIIGGIGCVGLLFFGGIVAAIAVPNLLNAIDRGKQKRTMVDVRDIGVMVEEYGIEHSVYPTAASMNELGEFLMPNSAKALPMRDGWGHEISVQASSDSYVLISPGKDGAVDGGQPRGPTGDFNDDIVFANGNFVQWPEGRQQ